MAQHKVHSHPRWQPKMRLELLKVLEEELGSVAGGSVQGSSWVLQGTWGG